jgi:fluoride ion exporter CrcB/FEX
MSFLIFTAYDNLEIGVLTILCVSTLAIAIIVKVFKHHNPLKKSITLIQFLGSLGYPTYSIDEKLGLLVEYFIYLLLVIIASAHYLLGEMVD